MTPVVIIDELHALELLDRAVTERNDPKIGTGGQVAVGKILGCSGSLVSQLQSLTYPNPNKWYRLIVEHFGNETVQCPTLGEIQLIRCAEEKGKPFAAPSSDYVRQRQACQKCTRRA